jgi:drug/metabolite transporter (DMT)-like permease
MQLIGAVVLLVASLSWTIGSIFSRRWQVGVTPFAASAWEMTFAGLVNLVIALSLGDFQTVQWTARGTGALIYLIIAGSWIGFTAYIWLLEHVPTAKVATYAYVNPVVAVALGWLILNEQVDGFMLAGTVIIVAAVVLVTRSKIKPGARSRVEIERPVEAHAD